MVPDLRSRVHWFTCTFQTEDLPDVLSYCSAFFGDYTAAIGVRNYRYAYVFDRGAYLRHSVAPDGSVGRADCSLDVSGGTLDQCSGEEIISLLSTCTLSFAGRPSRIDCAVDYHSWRISPADIWVDRGRCKGLKPYKRWENDTDGGVTAYFGRAGKSGSLASLKVYDKNAESGGEINACRWEARFDKEKADNAVRMLLRGNPGELEFGQRLLSLVFGVCDFVDDKGLRMPYYSFLCEGVERVKIAATHPIQEYSLKACERILRNHAGALAALRMFYKQRGCVGDFQGFIDSLCDEGEKKMDRRLRAAIDQNYAVWCKEQADLREELRRRERFRQGRLGLDGDEGSPF